MIKLLGLLNVAELNDNDTAASAFLKGMTNAYVKGALICGVTHIVIKKYQAGKK